MAILSGLISALAAILLLPTVSDLVSAVRAAFRSPMRRGPPPGTARLLFLVPAHNEELLIATCVRSLKSMQYPSDRYAVVVIADNCTDGTAHLAREAGAVALERDDRARPGKPRAIAWALEQVSLTQYDAVVIVDADTVVDPGFAAALSNAGSLRQKAVQAYFDVANPDDSALTRMAAVLAAANYHFAYPLKRRAGVNAPLLGNGMCIGVDVLHSLGWRAFSIAEDWELYAQFTAAGVEIHALESAHLYAQEARSLSQSSTQRQRWTAGKLTVFRRYVGAILRSGHIGLAQKLDAVAELSAPGPVVHLGLVVGVSALVLMPGLPAAGWLLAATWVPIGRTSLYGLAALSKTPDPARAALSFLFLPLYLLWRLGAAVTAMKMLGDKPWVRTARH